jgi:hypothetical protein
MNTIVKSKREMAQSATSLLDLVCPDPNGDSYNKLV